MKNLKYLVCLISLGVGVQAFAQGIHMKMYTEVTTISPKVGTAVGYSFDSQIELGGFYQQSATDLPQNEYNNNFYEKEFYGIYFGYPVRTSPKTEMKFNIRTGVTNGENFLITPTMWMGVRPVKRITVSAGIGSRAMRPTWSTSVTIALH